jgi:hypothetical protein
MTHAHTIHRTFMFETLANRFEQPRVAFQGDIQGCIS